MAEVIEVARDLRKAGAIGALGLFGGSISVPLFWSHISIAAPIFLLVVTAPLLVAGAWWLIRKPPILRATSEGMWFGGGSVVRWAEVKQIYVGRLDVQGGAMTTKTTSVAIDFESWRTMLRLPPMRWLGRILSVGDVDVSAGEYNPSVLVARLDAMRNRALGKAGTDES